VSDRFEEDGSFIGQYSGPTRTLTNPTKQGENIKISTSISAQSSSATFV